MQSIKINTYILCTALAVVILITSFVGGGARFARAAATTSAVEDFETQNVWEDLQGATIDGEGIDLTLYNFDEHKNVQLISFVEFCYSFRSDKQSDYGLYVYVYNPRGYDWTANSLQNKIQLRTGGNSSAKFEKYRLQYLNKSEKVGYEGLFYKFKIALYDFQRLAILASLNSNSRVYEVSGIELYSANYNATDYDVSNTYTYTGFAKGYGADGVESDSLNCKSSGLLTLTLDTNFADYRPEGSNGKNEYTQDLLHSVYFSIPNKILNKYGGVSAVHATWLNARTAPIYVTGDKDIYNGLYDTVWNHNGVPNEMYYVMFTDAKSYTPSDVGLAGGGDYYYESSGIGYNTDNLYYEYDPGLFDDFGWAFRGLDGYKDIGRLSYVFLADGKASDYVLNGTKVLEYIRRYSETLHSSDLITGGGWTSGGSWVADKYRAELFESYDKEFTEVNIHADDKYTLTSEKLDKNFIEKLFGGSHVVSSEKFRDIEAIHEVKKEDFKSNSEETCKGLYIDKSYYEDFKKYYKAATSRKETVFLFRYYQSEYESRTAEEFERFCPDVLIGSAKKDILKFRNTQGYFAQVDVNLDFDIIDVTCSTGEVDTVIACVMSPRDFVPNITPPLNSVVSISDWWKYALTATVALVAVTIGATFVEKRTKKMHEEER